MSFELNFSWTYTLLHKKIKWRKCNLSISFFCYATSKLLLPNEFVLAYWSKNKTDSYFSRCSQFSSCMQRIYTWTCFPNSPLFKWAKTSSRGNNRERESEWRKRKMVKKSKRNSWSTHEFTHLVQHDWICLTRQACMLLLRGRFRSDAEITPSSLSRTRQTNTHPVSLDWDYDGADKHTPSEPRLRLRWRVNNLQMKPWLPASFWHAHWGQFKETSVLSKWFFRLACCYSELFHHAKWMFSFC